MVFDPTQIVHNSSKLLLFCTFSFLLFLTLLTYSELEVFRCLHQLIQVWIPNALFEPHSTAVVWLLLFIYLIFTVGISQSFGYQRIWCQQLQTIMLIYKSVIFVIISPATWYKHHLNSKASCSHSLFLIFFFLCKRRKPAKGNKNNEKQKSPLLLPLPWKSKKVSWKSGINNLKSPS